MCFICVRTLAKLIELKIVDEQIVESIKENITNEAKRNFETLPKNLQVAADILITTDIDNSDTQKALIKALCPFAGEQPVAPDIKVVQFNPKSPADITEAELLKMKSKGTC